jgi:hypothetical protein
MKKLLYFLAVIGFLFVQESAAQNSKAAEVKFERYTSYFEKNNSGLKGDASYLVLKKQRDFDKVFGAGATMGENSFMPDGAFDSMIVAAAIKRGSKVRTYDNVQTEVENGKLYVRYSTYDMSAGNATFSSPLILAVPKGKYKKIIFVENGKEVKSLSVKK